MPSRIPRMAFRHDAVSLIAAVAAVFLGALDQTVIVTVLPAVVVDLAIPFNRLDQAAWIVSGYLLGYTVSLPFMGRFSDLRGRRLSFAIALAHRLQKQRKHVSRDAATGHHKSGKTFTLE